MSTVAFSSALSNAGVKYLAASPETMLAPGVPTAVAHDIAQNIDAPDQMARNVVDTTMDTYYGTPHDCFTPAAAFDVIDFDPKKTAAVASAVTDLNAALVHEAKNRAARAVVREDAKAIDGMVRFPEGKTMPWRADRHAIALYDTSSQDGRLSKNVRDAAATARDAIAATVMAHRESEGYAPFGNSDYSDAGGPTVHFPVNPKQVDPWAAGGTSQTDNAFCRSVGGDDLPKIVA